MQGIHFKSLGLIMLVYLSSAFYQSLINQSSLNNAQHFHNLPEKGEIQAFLAGDYKAILKLRPEDDLRLIKVQKDDRHNTHVQTCKYSCIIILEWH